MFCEDDIGSIIQLKL